MKVKVQNLDGKAAGDIELEAVGQMEVMVEVAGDGVDADVGSRLK